MRSLQLPVAALLLAGVLLVPARAGAAPESRPRLLVLTDIGGDPDDQQSMRRLMLYGNEFRIVGLIASASGTVGEVGKDVTRPELIREIVDDYAKVQKNLSLHADGYPSADVLRAMIKSGSPHRGIDHLGAGKETAGSRLIVGAVDEATAADPVNVAVWGGAHELAQALFDVRAGRSAAEVEAFLSKLRVYAIGDQDATRDQTGTGQWVRENFPTLRYVEAQPPGAAPFTGVYRGMYQNDATRPGGPRTVVQLVPDEVIPLNQEPWVEANVRRDHGPLGAGYPIVNQNPNSAHNTRGVKEGDTPSWFYVLPIGLGDPAEPTWGGWGGRFRHDKGGHFVDAPDEHWSGTDDASARQKWTVARWREAYQNDFAARMDWCVKGVKDANHPPRSPLDVYRYERVEVKAKPGEVVTLSGKGWTDPDGDALAYRWWFYREASEFAGALIIDDADREAARVTCAGVPSAARLHFILAVTDSGQPALTRYQRVVVTVAPTR